MKSMRSKIWALAIGVVLLLLIPLALTIRDGAVEGVGWNWSPGDFVFAFTLIFGTGLAFLLISSKVGTTAYRAAVGLALAGMFLLIWINGAVGIIGSEDNPANLMYGGVLAAGLIGATWARLRPKGMARVSFAMAIIQAAVPLLAIIFWKPSVEETPGIAGIFFLNSFFIVLFVMSALLFRQAGETNNI